MLAVFCLRLAFGLLAALLLLSPAQVNPRYFRTQLFVALALGVLATVLLWRSATSTFTVASFAFLILAFLGSASWSIEGHPGGTVLSVLAAVAAGSSLWLVPEAERPGGAATMNANAWLLADDLSAALVLGLATAAMLLGHFYLIAPGMSLRPLRRLLVGLFVAIGLRAAVAGLALWCWTASPSVVTLAQEVWLWLPLRWGLGLLLPSILGIMTWKTLNVPNTQSATGILYVVVIFCFLGELTSQLLLRTTGFPM